MKIAILGTRGIPANYGGFETFAEELSARLVREGHAVTVYCRSKRWLPYNTVHRGVQCCFLPTIYTKYLETIIHSFLSLIHVSFQKVDFIILCNGANAPFAFIPRLFRKKIAINVDGIERKRAKWNSAGKLWYRLGEQAAALFANIVIADGEAIADYYREQYKITPVTIPYGASPKKIAAGNTLTKFNLKSGEYVLYVSRLEPENNALLVIEAYQNSSIPIPLVIVGDAPYATQYKEQLTLAAKKDPRIIFTGFQFGDSYWELRSNAMFYIQATEVGGTHPALVEAMAAGNPIIANDVPEHREVLQETGIYYKFNNRADLAIQLQRLFCDQELRRSLSIAASTRAAENYSWDAIVDKYVDVM